jgi:DNA-binding response OmpR family regulator
MSVPVVALADPEDADRVAQAMKHGAVEYLTAMPEPEALQELLLGVNGGRRVWPPQVEGETVVGIRDLVVDFDRCQARVKGVALTLTPSEFALLATLVRHAGHVLSSQKLFFAMRGQQLPDHDARELVKVHLRRLRAKLDPFTTGEPYIVSVRGFGYMIERRAASRTERRRLPGSSLSLLSRHSVGDSAAEVEHG